MNPALHSRGAEDPLENLRFFKVKKELLLARRTARQLRESTDAEGI